MPPVDIDAAIISNTRLSDDYCVVALAAPAIAARAQPGQFVMVKPSRGTDPLLRRPFSIFEVLRDTNSTPTGVSILNKRIGIGTSRPRFPSEEKRFVSHVRGGAASQSSCRRQLPD